MADKYICTKCGRKYVDWGAKKLDFKCPTEGCAENLLVLLGSSEASLLEISAKSKATKRRQTLVPRADVDYEEEDLGEEYEEDEEELEIDDEEAEDRKPVVLSDGGDDKDGDTDDDLTVIADEDEEEEDEEEKNLSPDLDEEDVDLDFQDE